MSWFEAGFLRERGFRGISFELEQADIDPQTVPAYEEPLFRDSGPDELARAGLSLRLKLNRRKPNEFVKPHIESSCRRRL